MTLNGKKKPWPTFLVRILDYSVGRIILDVLIISTFRGTLQLKNVSYGIEPVETVSEFIHVIYEDKGYNLNLPLIRDSDVYSYNNSEYHYRKKSEVSVDILILIYLV